MKKLSLLFLSIAVAICASAGVNYKGNAYRPMGKPSHATSMKAPAHVDIITEQPEGTVATYLRSGEYILSSLYGYETNPQSGRVKVVYAPDGKTVYIQDIMCYGEGTGVWVQGELDESGMFISVPLGQYIAYNEEYDYGVVLSWGSTDVIDLGDDLYWLDFIVDDRATEVMYAIDPETGTITMMDSDGDMNNPYPYNCVATGLAGLWSDDGSIATIEWGSTWTVMSDAVPAVPANPEVIEFFDSGKEDGYTRFDFNINLIDVDGNPLDPDCLTYSIFTDEDELFTFDYDTYGFNNGLETDMTEIPYGFSGFDFYLRRVYFYRTNTGDNPMFDWRIGIQLNYTVDGITNKSDIVYLEVYPKPEPVEHSVVLVLIDANGNEVPFEMIKGDNGDYTTTVSLDYDTYGYVYYDATTEPVRHAVDYYFMIDGVRYGANDAEVATVLGTALDNELFATDGFYTLPVGYNYNMGVAFSPDGQHMYVYAAQADYTNVNELNAGKTVANVRYFNVMGQEMAQPEGMTIKVTTYTDGTTSAVKVMK